MAITILTPPSMRVPTPVPGGQAGLKRQLLACKWSTTDLTGTVPVLLTKVTNVFPYNAGAMSTASDSLNVPLQTFSATYVQSFVAPRTGTITAVGLLAPTYTSNSTSDTNFYTLGITDNTATTTVVDSTNAANSNKATGGSAFLNSALFAMTISNGAVTAGDVLIFTATKGGTFTVTAPELYIVYTTGGATSESLNWTDTRSSDDGSFNPMASGGTGVISLARKSVSPTSGRIFDLEIYGY